jgi:phosphoribosylformylglycinamidine (FGAM) synthase-like enzyme
VLETPVIGGNVSLYNENLNGAIYPTPVIGMVGLVEDVNHITTQSFKSVGDVILLLGETKAELGGSEFQYVIHGCTEGRPPAIDLEVEKRLQQTVLQAIRDGRVRSAHDLSDGGLAVALAESCITGQLGAEIDLNTDLRADIALFSESQSRVLLSVAAEEAEALCKWIQEQGVPCAVIGRVSTDTLRVKVNGTVVMEEQVKELERIWKEAIPCLMN